MVTVDDFMKVEIDYADLQQAVVLSLEKNFLDNLRQRNPFVQLDSKIRGYLGEFAIRKLIGQSKSISILKTDYISDGSYEDKDIVVENEYSSNIILEIKTSLFPDTWRTLDALLENADIKIIKRERSYFDIRADFHIQIYFNFYRKERDRYLLTLRGNPEDCSVDELIRLMKLTDLRVSFVAWIDKPTLIKNLESSTHKTWYFGYRDFWKCPLKSSNSPSDFIKCLELYKNKPASTSNP